MRVAFVINSLRDGGAERVLANLLAHVEGSAHDLHLILLDAETEQRAIPPHVAKHTLDSKEKLPASILQLHAKLQAIKPDVVVSFLVRANVAAIVAARALGIACIASERMQLSRHLALKHRSPRREAAFAAPRLIYPFADRIVAVSEGVRADLIAKFGASAARSRVIPNPYDLDAIQADGSAPAPLPLPGRFIVSVGRLTAAKNFAGLIEAYLQAHIPQALIILGKGEERAALEAQIRQANAAERILLPGYLENPFPVMARAHAYVSASLSEGFPNAMAEAMALGVPAVSTDCPSGPAELLADRLLGNLTEPYQGAFGVLVPERNTEALASAIRLICEPERHAHYASRASLRLKAYALDPIAKAWWTLIVETALERAS